MSVWPQNGAKSPLRLNLSLHFFSPTAMSAPLSLPKPLCPTFSIPAAQLSLNTSQLYPPPSIWLYCWLGMPGMSNRLASSSLSVHATHNQQCERMPGLVVTVFHSEVRSSVRPGTGARRHGQIGFNREYTMAPSQPCLPVCDREQVVPGRRVPIWGFTSASSTQRLAPTEASPLCRVAPRNRVAHLKYSCSTSTWWKDTF